MKKKLSLVLVAMMLLVVTVFAFAGCKDTPQDEAKKSFAELYPAGSTVVVGVTPFDPLNYKDDSGKWIGYDTEVAEAVFAGLGLKVTFVEIDWAKKYIELEAGNIDAIWNGFTRNGKDDGKERADYVDFSVDYMTNFQAVVINKKDAGTFTTASSLANKIGIAEAGSAGAGFADTLKPKQLVETETQIKALTDLSSGSADFAVVDVLLANAKVGTEGFDNLQIVNTIQGNNEFYAIGFRKEDPLCGAVNQQLYQLALDGTIATLSAKYKVDAIVNALYVD